VGDAYNQGSGRSKHPGWRGQEKPPRGSHTQLKGTENRTGKKGASGPTLSESAEIQGHIHCIRNLEGNVDNAELGATHVPENDQPREAFCFSVATDQGQRAPSRVASSVLYHGRR